MNLAESMPNFGPRSHGRGSPVRSLPPVAGSCLEFRSSDPGNHYAPRGSNVDMTGERASPAR